MTGQILFWVLYPPLMLALGYYMAKHFPPVRKMRETITSDGIRTVERC